MENYESLSNRKRPFKLDDLIGQDSVVSQIKGMIKKNRISRTILLSGPTGSGKTTSARLISKYVNCQNLKNGEICGKCASCKYDAEDHPDIIELDCADARKIDDVRNIKQQCKFKPTFNYRIYILDELHQLTADAKQSLLKTLEKPPNQTIFILCTTNPEKLPDTIRGRALKLQINRVSNEDCYSFLKKISKKEDIDIPKKVLKKIAEMVNGQPRDALQCLEAVINYINGSGKKDIMDNLPKIIHDIIPAPPEAIAIKFLLGFYLENYKALFKAIESIPLNGGSSFMYYVISFHKYVLYSKVCEELCENRFSAIDEYVKKHKVKISVSKMALILKSFSECLSKIKEYTVEEKILVIQSAITSIEIIKN